MKKATLFLSFVFLFLSYKIQAQHNQLWGMVSGGLTDGLGPRAGDVFHYNTDTMNVREDWNFPRTHPGTDPVYTRFTDMGTGKFYGMTRDQGPLGYGVIFEYDTATTIYTVKYAFDGNLNGANPEGSLTLFGGKLYGMARYGGTLTGGILFRFDPATSVFTVLYNFDNGALGKAPYGGVKVYGGKLYGMTHDGGTSDLGIIFKYDLGTSTFTKIHDFTGADGSHPWGDFTILGTKLYGMSLAGGDFGLGAIFTVDPATNAFVLKASFTNPGVYGPKGDLTFTNNKFYGLGLFDNPGFNGGVFEWDTATSVITTKITFNNLSTAAGTGNLPNGSFTLYGTKLYGINSGAGVGNDGTLFEYDPVSNVFTKKIDFGTAPFASGQSSGTCIVANGSLWGMGSLGYGEAFKYTVASNTIVRVFSFSDELNGGSPQGTLAAFNGKYYGIANRGGISNSGALFEYNPATHVYTKKIDFASPGVISYGSEGSLTLYGGKFYAMSRWGGTSFVGDIFQWDPVTNIYTSRKSFSGPDGSEPVGDLTEYNGKFYGMTKSGGVNSLGNIFEWDPVTNVLTDKIDFDDNNGSTPHGSLLLYNNKFYGMTSAGGLNGVGVIFEWDPVTNTYNQRYDFVGGSLGGSPYGNVSLFAGKLYGMTNLGGTSSLGVIFEYNLTTSTYTRKISFDGPIKGQTPYGSLTASGGKFYGMTYEGGVNNYGTFFEWNPGTNAFSKKYDFGDPSSTPTSLSAINPTYNNLLASNAFPVLSHLPGNISLCSTVSGTVSFNVTDADGDPLTITSTSSNTTMLPNANVTITYISDSTYHVTVNPIVGVGGTSTVNVIVNDGNGGEVNFSFDVTELAPPLQDVCSVTVDSAVANHNIIYWDKSGVTTAVDSFRIYREVTTGVYSNIASVFRDSLSEYHDFGANPNVTSYKYKIAVLDTCGNESPKSLYHSTIHLQVLGGGNLQWTLYDIESSPNPVVYYRVLRDDLGTGCCFNPISTTIPGGNTTYTDLAYASFPAADYRMEVTWSLSCNPTRTLINTTRSNIKHQNLSTNISQESLNEETSIYPNPSSNEVNVEVSEMIREADVSIYNSLGQKVFGEKINGDGVSKTTKHISIENYAKGIYTISIESNGTKVFKKLVVN